MKKGTIFFLGIITGCILTFVTLLIIAKTASENNENANITKFEQQTEFTAASKFEVFQVLEDGCLAHSSEKEYSTFTSFTGPIVYILSDGQNMFYDDQVIEVSKGKRIMQVGTFKYSSQLGERTVPVLRLPK